jgi:Fe-S-cluster-containing hydrogenase component 2
MKPRISRREFLKGAGVAIGGAATGVTGFSLLFTNGSNNVPKAKGHIVQLPRDESACTGCGTCELVCSASHGALVGPSVRRIWLERDASGLACNIFACLQCDFPGCYLACPEKDRALCIDRDTKTRFINPEACIPGCTVCIEACPLNPSRINYDDETQTALMCDLCKDRLNGPACIEYCPAQCLELAAT